MALMDSSLSIIPMIKSNPRALRGLHAKIYCLTSDGEICSIVKYMGQRLSMKVFTSLSVLLAFGGGSLKSFDLWSEKTVVFPISALAQLLYYFLMGRTWIIDLLNFVVAFRTA